MALQTAQVSFEPRLSTATHKADTALKNHSSHTVSDRYRVSNSVVFVHRAGKLGKFIGYPGAILAVLKGRTVAI